MFVCRRSLKVRPSVACMDSEIYLIVFLELRSSYVLLETHSRQSLSSSSSIDAYASPTEQQQSKRRTVCRRRCRPHHLCGWVLKVVGQQKSLRGMHATLDSERNHWSKMVGRIGRSHDDSCYWSDNTAWSLAPSQYLAKRILVSSDCILLDTTIGDRTVPESMSAHGRPPSASGEDAALAKRRRGGGGRVERGPSIQSFFHDASSAEQVTRRVLLH
jgi:hypothetical protein